jgi:hypothetical protein
MCWLNSRIVIIIIIIIIIIVITQRANAEYVNNTTRQQTPLHQCAQYWHKRDMSRELHFNMCKEIGVKLDKEHWY